MVASPGPPALRWGPALRAALVRHRPSTTEPDHEQDHDQAHDLQSPKCSPVAAVVPDRPALGRANPPGEPPPFVTTHRTQRRTPPRSPNSKLGALRARARTGGAPALRAALVPLRPSRTTTSPIRSKIKRTTAEPRSWISALRASDPRLRLLPVLHPPGKSLSPAKEALLNNAFRL